MFWVCDVGFRSLGSKVWDLGSGYMMIYLDLYEIRGSLLRGLGYQGSEFGALRLRGIYL